MAFSSPSANRENISLASIFMSVEDSVVVAFDFKDSLTLEDIREFGDSLGDRFFSFLNKSNSDMRRQRLFAEA